MYTEYIKIFLVICVFRATGGELQTFLDNEECLSEAQARICMRQVLKALQFLHKRSIVHLDLKPQNILLAGERIEGKYKSLLAPAHAENALLINFYYPSFLPPPPYYT